MVAKADTRFLEIDVLRGFAALAVVFSHYLPFWDRYAEPIAVLVPNAVGYWAVKLFFVISGFVIFFTLERCRTLLDFVVLRFSRLYPAYWASLLVATLVGVLLLDNDLWLGGLAANLTMAQQFFAFPHFDNVYWSLSVELAFYVNVGVLFALGLLRRVYFIVGAWLAVSALWVLGWHDIGGVTAAGRELVATDERDWPALLLALDYSPYFALGIVFYRSTVQGWTLAALVVCLFALGVEFLLAGWEGLVVAFVCTALFALAVNGRLRPVIGTVTLWLGAISYCLYLIHRNLGFYLLTWLAERDVAGSAAICVTVVAALLAASALAFGVERPVSRRIRAWYQARRVRPSVPR